MHAKPSDRTEARAVDARQHELTALTLRHAPEDGLHMSAIQGLALMRASQPSLPLPSLYEPSLCVVVQGRKRAVLGNDIYVYDALNYLVVSVILPVRGQIIDATPERPYLCLRIGVDTRLIGELLLQTGAVNGHARASMQAELDADRGLYIARTDEGLLDAVVRLVRLLDTPRDVPVLAPLVMREIHYRALTGEWGARLRELCVTDSRMQRVSHAIELLRTRFADSLSIDELADAAHMSASTFHHRFKEVTAMTPVQFQKHLRLHEARRLMLIEGLEASSAAHRVGYESPSQFSREYRRLFGAPPRREIQALRAETVD
jgi:AraC-like DNA-binding protein